jgi:hypothetical protein
MTHPNFDSLACSTNLLMIMPVVHFVVDAIFSEKLALKFPILIYSLIIYLFIPNYLWNTYTEGLIYLR